MKLNQKKLVKLVKKQKKLKDELQAIQAEEFNARQEIERLLVSVKLDNEKISIGDFVGGIKRCKNYSVTTASCVKIKDELTETEFESLFSVSYRLKPATYNAPTIKSKLKKAVKKHLVIKDAPLSVTFKEVE